MLSPSMDDDGEGQLARREDEERQLAEVSRGRASRDQVNYVAILELLGMEVMPPDGPMQMRLDNGKIIWLHGSTCPFCNFMGNIRLHVSHEDWKKMAQV